MVRAASTSSLWRRLALKLRRAPGVEVALVAAVIAAVVLTIVLAAGGRTAGLDARLSDTWFGSSRREPTGDIIIVDVTRAASEAGDVLHLPRARLAQLLRIFAAAGVRRTLVDLNLSGATTQEDDSDLEAALAALTPARVSLIASAIVINDPGGAARWKRTQVLERFARHAEPVASDLAFDSDGRLRRFGIEGTDLPPLLSGAVWLATGATAIDPRSRRLDYGIDASHIRVVDAADLASGRIDANQLQGRLVVLASFAAALGNEIRVPRFGSMRRSQITALAAETVLQERMLKDVGGSVVVPAAALLAFCMALWTARLGLWPGAAAVLGGCLCIVGLAAQLQLRTGLLVPAAALMGSVLIGYVTVLVARHPALATTRSLLKGGKNALLSDLMDETVEAIITFAPNGQVLSMNPAARALFAGAHVTSQTSVTDLMGSHAHDLLTATHASRPGRLAAVIDGDRGGQRHLDLTISSLQAGAEDWIGVASIRDVTDQQAQIEELRRMVVQDPLTGLVNRLGFERALAAGCESERVQAGSDDMAVLLCDLDGFKDVNDTYGHQAGDVILNEVAARLRAPLKPGTIVARLGGDEFGLLLRADRLNHAEVAELAAMLAASVSAPISVGLQDVVVGVSIGMAFHPSQGRTPESLVRVADAAMYLNKRARGKAVPLRRRASGAP